MDLGQEHCAQGLSVHLGQVDRERICHAGSFDISSAMALSDVRRRVLLLL
jgi:hypothetical protein